VATLVRDDAVPDAFAVLLASRVPTATGATPAGADATAPVTRTPVELP
jgi:hypothetical protein